MPVSYNFKVKAVLILSAETRNQHPVLLSSNAPKAEQNHEQMEPLCESQATPLPNGETEAQLERFVLQLMPFFPCHFLAHPIKL